MAVNTITDAQAEAYGAAIRRMRADHDTAQAVFRDTIHKPYMQRKADLWSYVNGLADGPAKDKLRAILVAELGEPVKRGGEKANPFETLPVPEQPTSK